MPLLSLVSSHFFLALNQITHSICCFILACVIHIRCIDQYSFTQKSAFTRLVLLKMIRDRMDL